MLFGQSGRCRQRLLPSGHAFVRWSLQRSPDGVRWICRLVSTEHAAEGVGMESTNGGCIFRWVFPCWGLLMEEYLIFRVCGNRSCIFGPTNSGFVPSSWGPSWNRGYPWRISLAAGISWDCSFRSWWFYSRMRSKGSRFTLGAWGLSCVRPTLRNPPHRSQPSATVRVRTVWPCLW